MGECRGNGNRLERNLRRPPHPLQYYLTPSPERDPANSLCLGCPVAAGGRQRTLQDFVVETLSTLSVNLSEEQLSRSYCLFAIRTHPPKRPRNPALFSGNLLLWNPLQTRTGSCTCSPTTECLIATRVRPPCTASKGLRSWRSRPT